MKDVHDQTLAQEWSVYIARGRAEVQQYTNVDSNAVEHFDINKYWTITVLNSIFDIELELVRLTRSCLLKQALLFTAVTWHYHEF
jgi:hypothetical protein